MAEFELAVRIYELRKAKGLSQKELGALVGVSNKAVSKWETGAAIPKTQLLLKLADIFGISAQELLTGIAEERVVRSTPTVTLQQAAFRADAILNEISRPSVMFASLFAPKAVKCYLLGVAVVLLVSLIFAFLGVGAVWDVLTSYISASDALVVQMVIPMLTCGLFTGVWYAAYAICHMPWWMKLLCVIGGVWLIGFLLLGGTLLFIPTVIQSVCVVITEKRRKSDDLKGSQDHHS